MNNDINLYAMLKETQPEDMSDKDFLDRYSNIMTKNTIMFGKSLMNNPHIKDNPKSSVKFVTFNSEDNLEYTVVIKRYHKYSLGSLFNKVDDLKRKIVKHFRTLDN